jgi:pyruvate,water dikinase
LFATLLDRARHGLAMRENVKNQAVRGVVAIRRALFEAGDRLVRRGIVDARGDVFFLTLTELGELLTLPAGFDVRRRIGARRAEFNRHRTLRPPPTLGLANVENPAGRAHGRASVEAPAPRPPSGDTAAELVEGPPARWIGLAVSPGIAVGKARVLLEVNPHQRLLPGEILVAPATDPGWTPYFLGAAAIVVDIGGQLSHGSILAREFGIPAVVNVGDATRRIRTGQRIRVDGDRGVVTVEG